MKKLFMTLTLLGFIFSFVACSDDDDKKATYGDLPTKAQTFLETHFGGNSGILNITKDNDSYDVIYDKFKIEFDLDGEWDSIDGTINRQSNAIPSTVIALIPSTIAEYVAVNQAKQGIGRLFLCTHELFDSHPHIIIDHHIGNAMYLGEEVTVRFHEGQRILMTKEPGITSITVAEGKDSHIQSLELPSKIKLNFAPVELTSFSRRIITPNKSLTALILL
ncbi:hypothetical protein [Dysgonomonas massiliensis]|uniref:hypothetical protein n=1 Tax=Dysgonomonas massiliensis TaxID=2040292 RepID=UPI00135AAEE8|nr:hypothetical protein [Dysgonomonas massiliensis]